MPHKQSSTLNSWVTVKKRTHNDGSSPEPGDPSAAPAQPPKKRVKAGKKGEAQKKKGSRATNPKALKEPTKEEIQWDTMIKDRGEWVVDEKYKCPYALTLTKTEALKYIRKCEPKLTQDELLTLEFETRPNLKDKDYQPSHQYCVLHINNLVHEKAKALGVTAQMPIPSDPPSSPPPLAGPSNAEQSNTVDPPLAQGSTSPDETRKGEPLP